jgi:hypothetical protein
LSEHALATVEVEHSAHSESRHWSGYASTPASARPRSSSGLRK